ncbi:DMT family transporter [Plantactinospora sp. KBS50]|uniref:DMT family transporter n=1 Tax=Plantactinospora sp. KBS50 TaxID=2024580 RepID=UPI0018E03ECF|nr:DMT family transporter [Plantactinospora sp. KBS50]
MSLPTAEGRAPVAPPAVNPVVAVCGAVFVYATGPVLISASTLGGIAYSFWRMLLALPLIGVLTWLAGRRGNELRGMLGPLPAVAGLALAFNQVLLMVSLKRVTVLDVTLVSSLAPVVTGIAAALLLGERLRRTFWWWTVIAMAGAGVVVAGSAGRPSGDPFGLGLAFLSMVAFTVFLIVGKMSGGRPASTPFTFGATCYGGAAITAYALVARVDVGLPHPRELVLLLGVVIGAGTFGHVVFLWALQYLPATFGSVVRLSHPFISGALAWIFLGQVSTVWHLAGGILTIGGVAGAALSGRSVPPPPPESV